MSPTPISFGQVIPVTGPVLGFAGTVSRVGERVITVSGSSARMAEGCKDRPVDTAIVGIVDEVHLD